MTGQRMTAEERPRFESRVAEMDAFIEKHGFHANDFDTWEIRERTLWHELRRVEAERDAAVKALEDAEPCKCCKEKHLDDEALCGWSQCRCYKIFEAQLAEGRA